jgi:hypothetical protein
MTSTACYYCGIYTGYSCDRDTQSLLLSLAAIGGDKSFLCLLGSWSLLPSSSSLFILFWSPFLLVEAEVYKEALGPDPDDGVGV